MDRRKTVHLRGVVAKANDLMARDTVSDEQKAIIFVFVQEMLLAANQYAGFNWNHFGDGNRDSYSRHFFLSSDLREG